jgi:hypothetical protein
VSQPSTSNYLATPNAGAPGIRPRRQQHGTWMALENHQRSVTRQCNTDTTWFEECDSSVQKNDRIMTHWRRTSCFRSFVFFVSSIWS